MGFAQRSQNKTIKIEHFHALVRFPVAFHVAIQRLAPFFLQKLFIHFLFYLLHFDFFLASEYYLPRSQDVPRRQLCFPGDHRFDENNDLQKLTTAQPCGIQQRLQANAAAPRYCVLKHFKMSHAYFYLRHFPCYNHFSVAIVYVLSINVWNGLAREISLIIRFSSYNNYLCDL